MELSKEVHRIGYHFSTFAVDKACQGLGVTLNAAGRVAQSNLSYLNDDFTNSMGKRHATHMSKANPRISRDQNQVEDTLSQEVIDSQARQAIRDLFPKIPERDLEEIILRAFDKVANESCIYRHVLMFFSKRAWLELPKAFLCLAVLISRLGHI